MKAQVIFDNQTKEAHFFSGWGFSCLLGSTLFDTGEKGPWLLENLSRLQHPLSEIERVVISHDHWDHWGGLWDLLEVTSEMTVYGCEGFSSDFKQKVNRAGGTFKPVKPFQEFEPNVLTTGEIVGTHSGASIAEQSLIVKTDKGLSIITGCAHPGIVRIVEQVRKKYPDDGFYAILGGFHLMEHGDTETKKIIKTVESFGFIQIGATHCSGKTAFEESNIKLFVGTELEL